MFIVKHTYYNNKKSEINIWAIILKLYWNYKNCIKCLFYEIVNNYLSILEYYIRKYVV